MRSDSGDKASSYSMSESKFLKTDGGKTKSNTIQIPFISLPKGGGAIKSIDEKFSVNAVNGTSSFSIPLPFSQARGGSPSLDLSYSSGAGNGIFGLGWQLSLASIKRKTDKGLPQYQDTIDSDTFLFSEADDLVPEFKKNVDGSFQLDVDNEYIINEWPSANGLFTIRNYKPRIEGLFARIERWTEKISGKIKWRVISKENVTTLFGWSNNSSLSDPEDPTKIFEWLPEYVFDDKGKICQYIYRKEDSIGFDDSILHNRNRLRNGLITYANLYIDKVLYGNKSAYKKLGDEFPAEEDYMFQTIFDYGTLLLDDPIDKINTWDYRPDAFSDYKAGFEIRTTRLCQRVLLFHVFEELALRPDQSDKKTLIRSVNFEYDTATEQGFSFLKKISSYGYIKKEGGTYSSKRLPPMEFDYQKHEWSDIVKTISPDQLIHAPSGLDEQQYQFTDLFNEGLSGILTEQANGWYYKHNLGNGKFEQAKLVSRKPSFTGLGGQLQLADLDADGGKQLVSYSTQPRGYFELDDDNEWHGLRSFKAIPNIDFGDANTRWLDLNGDGKPEIVISEENVFKWYPSEGRDGFAPARKVLKAFDEETGPHIIFADAKETIYLADMSGDGLTDILRIRNGEICYWPNLGYGKFGAKVTMDNAPVFDHADAFNPDFLRLADIDGSGTSDIIYLGKKKFSCWKNLSGNRFGTTPFEIDPFPEIHSQSNITVTDLLGNGVACIVWSSPLAKDATVPLKYIDLMSSKKPHIMVSYKNNLGKEVSLEYKPSTEFYLEDKLAGKPWLTKLHFPVHCVFKTTTEDKISGYKFVTEYKYHHGYYDHAEREFRGFGMVEQIDAESFEHWETSGATNITDASLHQEPVISKSWHHTGAFLRNEKILDQFANDYWYEEIKRKGFTVIHPEVTLPDALLVVAPGMDSSLVSNLSSQEWQEAFRACKGMALRSETFARDAIKFGNTVEARKRELTPFSVATHNCVIELLQPKGKNNHAVFVVKESEAITYSYERNTEDPRIAHNLNLKLDEYGNVLESASVVYPRKIVDATLPLETQDAQSEVVILYSQNQFTNDVTGENTHRLRLPSEVKTFQLKGVANSNLYYSINEFTDILTDAISDTAFYHEINKAPVAGTAQKRLIEHVRSTYYQDNLSGPLQLHQLESLALPFESYQLAYTPELITDIFGTKVNAAHLIEGKFTPIDNNWWVRSGTIQFKTAAESQSDAQDRFYSPVSYTDPYGAITKVKYYKDYFLFVHEMEDALGNISKVENVETTKPGFNFRTLTPEWMKDINGNYSAAISDELGLVKAVAVMGKGNEADELTGILAITDVAESGLIQNFFQAPDSTQLTTIGKNLLEHASARFVYDLEAYTNSGKPVVVASITREQHFIQLADSPVQIAFAYSNGIGEVVMKKGQAEPGLAKQVIVNPDDTISINEINTGTDLRWIGNGRIIKNNKGNAVKQYEPYFSVNWHYEDHKELVETGVTPILYYDAAGRLVRTEIPDGTFSRVEFDSWKQLSYDANDTVLEQGNIWYSERINGSLGNKEKLAAEKAAKHANTPTVLHFDTLGRPVLSVDNNKNILTEADEFFKTKIKLDPEGNLRSVIDARELLENSNKGNTVMEHKYDMLGNLVYQNSMDAGQRWLLVNILGKPLRTWDERDHEFQYEYDELHRPTRSIVINTVGKPGDEILNHIYERIIYGESLLTGIRTDTNRFNEALLQDRNVLGQVIQHYDTGGLVDTPAYDFKGQPPAATRKLFSKYKEVANWTDANLLTDLENVEFTYTTETDALGRITKQTAPDGSIITPSYNEAGLLDGESVLHPGVAIATNYIKDIDYNEKGQRNKIIYGNDVSTHFEYDSKTFRIKNLVSTRQNSEVLQDLNYTYDPVGNIIAIQDNAIPISFFANTQIEPVNEYIYDALYRLVEATGRENNVSLLFNNKDNWNDAPYIQQVNPGGTMAVWNYTQQYSYDEVGNINKVVHKNEGSSANWWTRIYEYEKTNNRLISTKIGAQPKYNYPHHPQHGYITIMPHLDEMRWNFKEELVSTISQKVNPGNGIAETTYYQYDGQGQRIRKITENFATAGNTPTKKEERIYISGFELYKKHSTPQQGLERTTLSLMDGGHRFVMIETRNNIDDDTEKQLVRYQLHNHIGSASLELDDAAQIISYEEYHPYGTTAYHAKNNTIKSAAKRYRYTGMERDEETGLEYHSARYYLPWLGRWLSSDPIGLEGGINDYGFCDENPIKYVDSNGKQAYQRYFNEKIVELIVESGNQDVIKRLLVKDNLGNYKLNTSYQVGFNAGHQEGGDRKSDAQKLSIERATTNQLDGAKKIEKNNRGMDKRAYEVKIGNGITIPIERYTAHELELEKVLPAGTSNLPEKEGWTKNKLNFHLAAMKAQRVTKAVLGSGIIGIVSTAAFLFGPGSVEEKAKVGAQSYVVGKGLQVAASRIAGARVAGAVIPGAGFALGLCGDSAGACEQQASEKMIHDRIKKDFPGEFSNEYCLIGLGWPCTEITTASSYGPNYQAARSIVIEKINNEHLCETYADQNSQDDDDLDAAFDEGSELALKKQKAELRSSLYNSCLSR
ncbi:SpvB/TcaC N-terminal domain-containing protein [Lacibacter sp.]|uniref:SpvB/TcaC N-terminal domain-containing protein n=1 Tax=Lacibacter sp. TaxID=1915409 RepID=UPI002B4B0A19|nr:SpvB/TcaC N-terminal domain-containing protein [Lacibacter sp.]HLP37240.1 SpvB/TcaC N-terminal domain-containing protein [Lacibacter sp.]